MPGVIEERLAGCIKWLPHKNELRPADSEIDEGACHHPVVVLSTRVHDTRVEILILTSFGGLDLAAKFPTKESARRDHLPIAPSSIHPDNGILLLLEDSGYRLRKNSWVKTRNKHSIRLASLLPYDRRGPEVFLSRRSYQTLVQHIQFVEPARETPSYALTPERSISVQRSSAADDVASSINYYTWRIGSSRVAEQSHIRPQILSNATIATRVERQPLLPATNARPLLPTPAVHSSRYYGRHTTIQEGYGHGPSEPFNWAKFWRCIWILWCICLVVFVSYELYLGGVWVITTCGRGLDWMKEEASATGESIKSAWVSFVRYLGL
ncbi:hypothetical protein F5Y10DRAFT_236713 [Nemania abortiva]|nr:hypothetical protein F5Y10DRAFT_236713 [Nemania abortiva]